MSFQPKNLNEAVDHILQNLVSEDNSIKFMELNDNERKFISKLHFLYGMWMRNSWYLWWHEGHAYESWPKEKPPIVKFFNDLGIYHADDMSGIILTTVHRKYFNKPIELEAQVQKYQAYWLDKVGSINPMK